MTRESRHISEWIDGPADDVYEYAGAPDNLPQWARGLGSSVDKIGDRWFAETRAGALDAGQAMGEQWRGQLGQ
jgi:hypothetical protein